MGERVGVLGGSFNPVHMGHVAFLRHCVQELRLNEGILLPVHDSYEKLCRFAPAHHRLKMCEIAISGERGLSVCDWETRQSAQPPTAQTLAWLAQERPGAKLFLLIGDDVAAHLPKWKDFAQLTELAAFALARRGAEWNARLGRLLESGAQCVLLEGWQGGGVSSSGIRRQLRGRCIAEGLDPQVLDYIEREKLYGVNAINGVNANK